MSNFSSMASAKLLSTTGSPAHVGSSRFSYRPELDGMRALAVIAVICFHGGWTFFSGGFLGVDIFFVLSGYLIGSILLKESEVGPIAVGAFLERRFRRILPALVVLCFICIIPSWFYLPPSDFKGYTESVLGNALSVTNYYFLAKSDYFDQASAMKPLLHTWSLSVEIQFYLFASFCVWISRKFKFNSVPSVAVVFIVLSLSLFMGLLLKYPNVAFYIFPARLWEFVVGILAALVIQRELTFFRHLRLLNLISGAGMLLILLPLLAFKNMAVGQSLATFLVVLGTALVIVFATPITIVSRLLSFSVLVNIGLISYSLYLIHNPIQTFGRFAGLTHSFWVDLCLFAAMLLSAYLSWRYVENPFRNRSRVTSKHFKICCGFGFVFAVGLFALSKYTEGFLDQRLSQQQKVLMSTAVAENRGPKCQTGGNNFRHPSDPCVLFGESPSWAIVGDSHAGALAYGMAQKIHDHTGQATQWLSMRGCPPGYSEAVSTPCEAWTHEVASWLGAHDEIKKIIVVYRLNVYFFGNQVGEYPKLGEGVEPAYRELVWKQYSSFINVLKQLGKEIVIITPIPEPRGRVEDLIFNEGRANETIVGVRRSDWDRRNAYTMEHFKSLPTSVYFYNPESVLCDDQSCYAVEKTSSYYHDHNHLSVVGIERLTKDFAHKYWGENASVTEPSSSSVLSH
jgi:peptidoglycan/LPS O-acetylase OafA/YrhL